MRAKTYPAVLLLVVTFVAGCSSQTKGPGVEKSASAATSGGPASSAYASAEAASPSPANPTTLAAVLTSVALHDGDLTGGYKVALIPQGDQVTNQVSLDNCGFNFTTEANRVARRQYGVTDSANQDTGISNELLAYDSPANATLALSQWHQAITTCPRKPVQSKVAAMPDATYTIISDQFGVSSLPNPNNEITVEMASAQDQTLYFIAIQQIHGRYLDSLYANSDTAPTQGDIAAATQLATDTGDRLAAESTD